MRGKKLCCLLLAACLLLGGCGAESVPRSTHDGDFTPYAAPPFADAVFHEDRAETVDNVRVDLSALEEGYIAVAAQSASKLKFQTIKGEMTLTYDLPGDGTPTVFPLSCGDGDYSFRVMENLSENKYAPIYTHDCTVKLSDEFQPFLRPSVYVDYTRDSACVKKAQELAAACGDALEVVSAVYAFVTKNVSYDKQKAETVRSGYRPDPDETLSTGKGICFDYASLAAAMLRSQGIPTKLIFGYVSPNDVYHAWNMFYTEESGWVTVSFEVSGNSWNRMDLTFSAGGAAASFIGDGSNYADVYAY